MDQPRALLVNNGKGIPLLWQVLGNKYKDNIKFSVHRDRGGKSSTAMGLQANEKGQSQVLIYPPGQTDFIRYDGTPNFSADSGFGRQLIHNPIFFSPRHDRHSKARFIVQVL